MNDYMLPLIRKATEGIIKQGCLGKDPGGGSCWYRTPQGRKCGIGQLISDEHYVRDIEGFVPDDERPGGGLIREVISKSNPDFEFQRDDWVVLNEFQRCHDLACDVKHFVEKVNIKYNLDVEI